MKKKSLIVALCLVLALLAGGCSGGQTPEKQQTEASGAVILKISGYNGQETSYTKDDLEKLGAETLSYSGRNKEKNNERQIRKYTGVELKKLMKAAGYGNAGDAIKITCSDGYSREYEVDSLYDLYFFDGEKAQKGEKVAPMLAIIQEGESIGNGKTYAAKDGSPLRLVYGQTDYDSDYTKDFNMQGWASYVEKIEVSKADE